MKQSSVLYVSLVILSCGMGLTAACSDDSEPSECTGDDCGGATVGGGGGSKATGGTKAVAGATSTARGGSSATGGSSTSGGASTAAGGASVVGGASATGGTSAATGGTTAAAGGTTAATGGTTAATGGTKAVGGTTAAGGATTAVAGSTSLGGASNIAGNAGTANNNAGTAGTAGAAPLGPNLALGAKWWGTATTGEYPHAFGDVEKPVEAPNTNTPANLFDGNKGNLWVSGKVFTFDTTTGASTGSPTPQVAGVEFASPQLISAVVLHGRLWGDRAYNPSDYTIETSDTGVDGTWTARATLTRADTRPICQNQNPDPLTHILPTPVTAKWIRLRVTDVWYVNWSATTSTWSPAGSPANAQAAELEIY